MTKDKIISIHGAYFGTNFGDHLLIRMLVDWVKEFAPGCQINLPTCPQHNLERLHGDSNDIALLDRSATLIFAGGGYLGEPGHGIDAWSERNYDRYVSVGLRAVELNIPIAIVGVGVGPITQSKLRDGVIKIINHASLVAVRDEESFEHLRNYGARLDNVIITADSALTLSSFRNEKAFLQGDLKKRLRIQKVSGKLICGLHFAINPKIKKFDPFFLKMKHWAKKNRHDWKVLQFTDNEIGSGWSMKTRIMHALSLTKAPYRLVSNRSIEGVIHCVAMCDWVITNKLHVGIVASALDIPVLSIPSHPKTKRFYKQLGLEWRCHSLAEVDKAFSPSTLEAVQKRSELNPDLLTRAWENKNLLQKFLADKLA